MKTPVKEKLKHTKLIVASKNNDDCRPRIHKCKRSKYLKNKYNINAGSKSRIEQTNLKYVPNNSEVQ